MSVDLTKPIDISYQLDNQSAVAYFKTMSSKMGAQRKVSLMDAFILSLMFVNAIKHFVLIFIDIDFETSIMLADLSVIIDGVRGYILTNIGLSFTLGLLLHNWFYIRVNPELMVWTELFDVLMGRQSAVKVGFNVNDSYEFKKFLVRSVTVFGLMNMAIFSISKN